jgi:hypothetical protein
LGGDRYLSDLVGGDGFQMFTAGILRNTGTMQTWLLLIKEPEKNNTYVWLPSPNDTFPYSPFAVIFLMPIPLQPPFFHHRGLKIPSL